MFSRCRLFVVVEDFPETAAPFFFMYEVYIYLLSSLLAFVYSRHVFFAYEPEPWRRLPR